MGFLKGLKGVNMAPAAVMVHTDILILTVSVAGSHGLTHPHQYIMVKCCVLNGHEFCDWKWQSHAQDPSYWMVQNL